MFRRAILRVLPAVAVASAFSLPALSWADAAPNAFIQSVSDEVLTTLRNDAAVRAGQFTAVMAAVDRVVLPNINFTRMTASATGPKWRQATPEQRVQLQNEFKILLVRTYAGALNQVSNETIKVLPLRGEAGNDVLVRSQVIGRAEPIQLDYRLEKTAGKGQGWQIYDVNVMGVWMVDSYRNQFAQALNSGGVDGLIKQLTERNKANASATR